MTYPELEGRTALVTGGTSGIGKACVERLRADGMTVVFTGRNETRGEAVAAATGARFLRCDARDRAASDRAVEDALAVGGGRLDALVANAGILMGGPIEETPEAAFRELLEVNLTALFRVSPRLFRRHARAGRRLDGPHLLRLGHPRHPRDPGVLGDEGRRRGASPSSLPAEGAPHGIRANAVCPGDVVPGVQATPVGFEHHAEYAGRAGRCRPGPVRHRRGRRRPRRLAGLATSRAHVTGATLRIDGGAGAAFRAMTRA